MKQKTIASSENTIRTIIKEELHHYASKKDLNKAMEKQDEKFKEYKDEILTKLDGIVAELENHRIDRDLDAGQTRDHEERITKIEKHLNLD